MATAFAEETKKEVKKDVTSLRSALEWLDTQGDVIKTEVEVDPDLEITGVQKHLDGGPVVLFNKVKGKPHVRAITNLLADMNVVDKLFGYKTPQERTRKDRKSTRLNSSHSQISYAVFCLKKKKKNN